MKTGIFGGTFDPVHIGHVRAAEAFISELGLDRLFVLPNYLPPLKDKESAPIEDRFEMLKIAFPEIKKVIVDDFELKNGGTSYTYKTVEHFKNLYPDDEFFLLIGDDNLLIFQKWVNFEYILKNCTLCISLRSGCDIEQVKSDLQQNFQAKIKVLFFTPTVISSSLLRKDIIREKVLADYLPQKVFDYINEKGLYR